MGGRQGIRVVGMEEAVTGGGESSSMESLKIGKTTVRGHFTVPSLRGGGGGRRLAGVVITFQSTDEIGRWRHRHQGRDHSACDRALGWGEDEDQGGG